MNNEKKIIIILSVVAICALGAIAYTYLLSSDLDNTTQKLALLEQSIAQNSQQQQSQGGGLSKFKITWKCKKVSKKVELTEEEYNAELAKMKRIGRSEKEANKVKNITQKNVIQQSTVT